MFDKKKIPLQHACLLILVVSGFNWLLIRIFDDAISDSIYISDFRTPISNVSRSMFETLTLHIDHEPAAFHPMNWSFLYYQHPRKAGGTSLLELFDRNGLCSPLPEREGKHKCHTWGVSAPGMVSMTGKSLMEHKQKARELKQRLIHNEWFAFDLMDFMRYGPSHWNDVLLVTMLRDPIDRVYSDLLHDGAWSCGYLKRKFNVSAEEKERIMINCTEQYQSKFTSNMYTKIFSGSWSTQISDAMLDKRGAKFNRNHTVNEMHLQIAKQVLQQFHVVMILEMYDEMRIQLECNGISNTTLQHERTGKTREKWQNKGNVTVSEFEDLRKLVVELNQFDIQLFHFAKDLAVDRTQQCREYLNPPF